MRGKRWFFWFLFWFSSFLFWGFSSVTAVGGISILPARPSPDPKTSSWFVYKLDPGEEVEDEVAVVNLSEEKTRVKIYPVDAVSTQEGGFALKQESEEKIGVGRWISIEEEEVVLDPNERKNIGFFLKVPEKAEPGDYLGGIVAQPISEEGEGNVKIVTRTGVRVYLTVKGEQIKKGEVKEFVVYIKDKKLWYSFKLKNKGTVRLEEVKARLDVKNILLPWQSASWNLKKSLIVLPKNEVVIREPIPLSLSLFGFYRVWGEISWEKGSSPVNSEVFWINWQAVILIGGGLFGFLLCLFWFKRLKTKRKGQKGKRIAERDGKQSLSFALGEKVGDEEMLELLIRRVIRQELLLFREEMERILKKEKKTAKRRCR